jgi:hypothetical protein
MEQEWFVALLTVYAWVVQAAGGFSTVAQQLGFRSRRRPVGYWEDEVNLDMELEWFVAAHWTEHREAHSGDLYYYSSLTGEASVPLLPGEAVTRWAGLRLRLRTHRRPGAS